MLRVYAGSVEGPMGFGQKGGNATCSLGKGGGGVMEVGKHRN